MGTSRGLIQLLLCTLLGLLPLALSGCGGTSGGVTTVGKPFKVYTTIFVPTPNNQPSANAGLNQTVTVLDLVKLSGAGTDPDGDILGYHWSITSRPSGSYCTLNNPASPASSFTPDTPGDYTVQLIVDDGRLYSQPSTITITALNPAAVATDTSGKIMVEIVTGYELFRDSSQVTFGVKTSVANSNLTRQNIALTFSAIDSSGNALFTTPVGLEMGLTPVSVTQSQISSFKLPISVFDSIASWNVATLITY